MFGRKSNLLLLLPVLVFLSIFILALFLLFLDSLFPRQTFSFSNYISFFQSPVSRPIFFRTVYLSAVVTIITLLLSFPIAYIISTSNHKSVYIFLIIIPWLVSIVVRTYGWMVLLGIKGTLNSTLLSLGLLSSPARLIFSPTGIVIGLVHVLCPFAIFTILSALIKVDRSIYESARMLKASPFQTLYRITIPLSIPSLVSSAILVYLLSSGAIVTPLLLGGVKDTMLATQIYQDTFQLFRFDKAASMAFILVSSSLLLIIPLTLFERYMTTYLRD